MFNSFGHIFRLTTFGESHGDSIGGVVDGCPAGFDIHVDEIQYHLNRRKPGQSSITTSRKEGDKVKILSGLYNGKSTGAPIAFTIENKNKKSKDYENIQKLYRPSHADYTYHQKYGNYAIEGGGRASARETANWVVAGSIARQILKSKNIDIYAYVSQIGSVRLNKKYFEVSPDAIEKNIVRCPDEVVAQEMINLVESVKKQGDTIGGKITCVVKNMEVGIGEPVFEKFQANLAKAMMSINAVKGFEYGEGFASVEKRGSEINDEFIVKGGKITTKSNYSGGIQGGISNGQDVYFNVAFKPVSSIFKEQNTVTKNKEAVKFQLSGRHDPCVVPRAVVVVESLAAMVILDAYMMNAARKLF